MLADLDDQLRALDLSLIQKRSSERRIAILIVAYSALLYLLLLLYVFFYPWRQSRFDDQWMQQAIDGAILVLYPLAVWMVRRAVVWVCRRRILATEQQVKAARLQQKQTVEELKKQTSYYQTKGLLERFDPDFAKTRSPAKPIDSKPVEKIPPPSNPINTASAMRPMSPQTIIQHVAVPTWFDRLMDSLIGDDRMSKYALICPRCHSHNGLVRPEEFDTIQYSCPNCKLFIPSRKPTSPLPSGSPSLSSMESQLFSGEPDISSDTSMEVPPPAMSPEPSEEIPVPEVTPSPSPSPVPSPAPSAGSGSTMRRRKK